MKKTITTLAIAVLGIVTFSNAQDSTYVKSDSTFNNVGNSITNDTSSIGNYQDSSSVNNNEANDTTGFVTDPDPIVNDSSFVLCGNCFNPFDSTSKNIDSLSINLDYDNEKGFVITWEEDTTFKSFCYEVATDSNFYNIVEAECSITDSIVYFNLGENAFLIKEDTSGFVIARMRASIATSSFYLRVGALNNAGVTTWSTPQEFRTSLVSSVVNSTVNNSKTIEAIYNLQGKEVSASESGLVIVKYSDGTTQKVFK